VTWLQGALSDLRDAGRLTGVLLSGGEPALHPGLPALMRWVSDRGVPRRVLITNGERLAHDPTFLEGVLGVGDPWEVFLQFDSMRPDVLRNIRGSDLTAVRAAALARLADLGVPTTLVCVVKTGLNDDEVTGLTELAMSWANVVGIQFQPMKEAGRTELFEPSQRGVADQVRAAVERSHGSPTLVPHPASPLSVSVAHFSRVTGDWQESIPEENLACFIEPTRAPDGRLRVVVLEYADTQDWSSLRAENPPYVVLAPDGTVSPVDDYFIRVAPGELVDLGMPVVPSAANR
jgi:MoaA/NifB/PqqE/SkfB family radical SAM enzyme